MVTTPSQIDRLLNVPSEHQKLEFKEAKHQFDTTKLNKYCVAIANEGGGTLILGVSDKFPRQVVGTQAFLNLVDTAERIFRVLGFRVDIEEVSHSNGRVLVFHIPPRPRGTAYQLDGAYFMRSGEELVAMSEDRLRAIFAEGRPDWLEETSKSDLSAEQIVASLDTHAFFALMEQPYPTTQKAVLERLVAERLIDETFTGYSIRRIGAILLARSLAEFPDLSRKAARIVVYSTSSKSKTILDQIWELGYANGFRSLISFVYSQIRQKEIVEESLRKKVTLLPEIVIREIVANAMIHQDFTVSGASLMLEIYPDRVEISNPGEPIVPVERFIDGYQSRNERLADIMRRMHICEEKSSGIDQVILAAESSQLPPPEFLKELRRTTVVIPGPRPFKNMDREARIRACYQHCVLRYIQRENMTNQTLRARFGLGVSQTATISQLIKASVEARLIRLDEEVGESRKLARYLPFWA